mgnify:CR=1 FL=1
MNDTLINDDWILEDLQIWADKDLEKKMAEERIARTKGKTVDMRLFPFVVLMLVSAILLFGLISWAAVVGSIGYQKEQERKIQALQIKIEETKKTETK